jgi:F420H(2)-dependent quinone reductase
MPKSPQRNLNSPYADFFIKWMSRSNTWLYKVSGGRLGGTFQKGGIGLNSSRRIQRTRTTSPGPTG